MTTIPFSFVKQRQLNVSGLNRINPSENSSIIKYDMNYAVRDYNRLSILRYEIPKNWYTLETNADLSMILKEDGGADLNITTANWLTAATTVGGSAVAIIQNPSATQFAAILAVVLDNAGAGTYTVGYNSNNGKLYLSATGITSFEIRTLSTTLARYLGLDSTGVSNNKALITNYKYTSGSLTAATPTFLPTNINLQRYDELYIRSGISQGNWDNLVMTVNPHNAAPLETIEQEAIDVIGNSVFIDTTSSHISFELMGDDGKSVDLHGGNWRMTMVLWKDNYNSN